MEALPLNSDLIDSKKLLKAFNCMYGRRQTVDTLLQQATRVVVKLLEVRSCMITCLTKDKGSSWRLELLSVGALVVAEVVESD